MQRSGNFDRTQIRDGGIISFRCYEKITWKKMSVFTSGRYSRYILPKLINFFQFQYRSGSSTLRRTEQMFWVLNADFFCPMYTVHIKYIVCGSSIYVVNVALSFWSGEARCLVVTLILSDIWPDRGWVFRVSKIWYRFWCNIFGISTSLK